jgi:hypothetical protein
MVYPMPAVSVPLEWWGGWDRYQYSLLTSQHAALVLLVVHFGKTDYVQMYIALYYGYIFLVLTA